MSNAITYWGWGAAFILGTTVGSAITWQRSESRAVAAAKYVAVVESKLFCYQAIAVEYPRQTIYYTAWTCEKVIGANRD